MDTDNSKAVEFTDFKWGLKNYGLNFNVEEVKVLFNHFDKNKSGTVNCCEFVKSLRVNNTAVFIFIMFIGKNK
jgi:Ca2+-binding EF-hand superfamily protein